MSLADQQWCPTSVQVTVLQARGLRIKGKSGTNDAYAVMQVGKEKYQTSVVEKSVAPVWREEAAFDLPSLQQGGGGGTERSTLHVHVLHRALVGPDKLLGQAVINLLQLSEDKTRNKTEWFKLLDKTSKADKDRGEVLVDIQFLRNNMTASMFDLSAAGKSKSRLGKFKDKVRGKKKETDAASTGMASFSQVLTDSEEEGNGDDEVPAGKDEKKKKLKMKSLFSPKSNLQKTMSQSMSVLPAKNSSLSGSQSSGLNVDSSEGKKKFKFMIHKRSGSSDSKESSSGHQKHGAAEQSNLCINGSHVYCEEPQSRTSRIGSNFSLTSSGHGSMEDVPESSPPSVHSLRAVRQYSPWTEEEEETTEVENIEEDVGELRREEEERIGMEEERRTKEEERVRKQDEELERFTEEKKRQEEEKRAEEERVKGEEEERIRRQEEERTQAERRRQEEEERVRREEERERLAEENGRLEEQEMRRIEEEEKRLREEGERLRMEEEARMRQEEEHKLAEEKRRLEEQEMRRIEEEEKRLREEGERLRMEEEARMRQEEEHKLAEEKRRLEEQEMRRIEEEEKRLREEGERLRMEEEARMRQEEEHKLAEEKRRLEEKIEEEKVRQEERAQEERRQEEMVRRQEKELEEKRILEEQERQRKEEEIIKEKERRQEEEKARRERDEYERLVEEKRKLEEEESKKIEEEEERRRVEEEKRAKEEEEERVRRQEEEREKLAEQKRILEEQERRRIEDEEKRQRAERISKEEERRRKEEERIRRQEKEEVERLAEEERRREEEERVRKENEEMERLAEEKRRLEEQEMKRTEEEERARREEKAERESKEEQARKLEKEKFVGEKRRENETKHKAAEMKSKVAMESPADVTSTNPFDENLISNNPFEEIHSSPAGPDSSTAKVPTVRQRCQSAESSVGSKTVSTDEKDLISSQREKRPAPQPPGRNQAERESQKEQDGTTPHLAKINKHSKGKDVKTISVLPQRSVQIIAPVSRSPTETKNTQSLPQSSTTEGTTNVAKHSKRPAPSRPRSVEEGPSSEPKTALSSDGKIFHECGSEAKQQTTVYGLNPFEDDEDDNELTANDDTTTSGKTGSVQEPPAVSQGADKGAASQTKIKSSKVARAPPLPTTKAATSSTLISQNTEESQAETGVMVPDNRITDACVPESISPLHVQESPSAGEEASGKKGGPPTGSRRLQPVKPLNPLEQQSVSVVGGEKDNKSTGILCGDQQNTKANDTGPKGPYSQLTQEELISLVLKQKKQLSERDKKISELEQYIDNLLVRVIEEQPSILMSMNSLKKSA